MRHLLQPRVLKVASIASAVTALASYPRLSLWLPHKLPVWYMESVIFVCCIILWGFVFAWHEPYTGRPVFLFQPELAPFMVASIVGIVLAAISHFWMDPVLRSKLPEEYPPDWLHWLAALPFILAFNQLFLIFAPLDWLMRLTKNRRMAVALSGVLAGALVLYKLQHLGVTVSPHLLTAILAGKMTGGFLAAWIYLRGGVGLVSWWTLLLESRHVLDFMG